MCECEFKKVMILGYITALSYYFPVNLMNVFPKQSFGKGVVTVCCWATSYQISE